ncbi:Nicastrin [Araneus ventricosus]|uniref:Nicastrin n=1 Tax=Araneus ventricosus TaxID=182803 RepID=A0A4Y2AQM9_ARAVE|nr:Nicastrin [Araneus ventricosus]
MKELIIYSLAFFIAIQIQWALADRTSLKIYKNIQSDIFCFRRLNATHQIGCASHSGGNVGVLYLVDDDEEVRNITAHPPPMPFVIGMPIALFKMRNMKDLKQTGNIRGVLLFKPATSKSLKNFSPDQSCPNRNFGFYTEKMNVEYAACKKKEWNNLQGNDALGMMFEDWGMPIFIITNKTHIKSIKKCYSDFNNGTEKNWPLCSVQMSSVMLAAKDSDTCMRRNKLISNLNEVKTCDPLSDKNIVNTLFPTNKSEEIADTSFIVVSARLDAFSMFDKLAPGAHSTVTGLVTLLSIAKNMDSLRKRISEKEEAKNKNVLFIIFNGEAFDYIGSSRVVFDMQKGLFPVRILDGIKYQPSLINLTHISHFIELSQLAPPEIPASLWLHTDPVSTKSSDVSERVKELIEMFKSEAEAVGLNVSEAPSDLPLPPASFQSFLKHDKSIPGIVIADHDKEFINKYYNSIFDTNEALNVTLLTQVLTNISTAVSGTLYQLLTKEKLNETLDSTENLVSGLLECYLQNASCPLFREIADPDMTERLRVEPYPLYVSVDSGGHTKANAITIFTRYLLAYLTGEKEHDRDRKNCTGNVQNQIYHYDWMAGSEENTTGVCIKSTVMYYNSIFDTRSPNVTLLTQVVSTALDI